MGAQAAPRRGWLWALRRHPGTYLEMTYGAWRADAPPADPDLRQVWRAVGESRARSARTRGTVCVWFVAPVFALCAFAVVIAAATGTSPISLVLVPICAGGAAVVFWVGRRDLREASALRDAIARACADQ